MRHAFETPILGVVASITTGDAVLAIDIDEAVTSVAAVHAQLTQFVLGSRAVRLPAHSGSDTHGYDVILVLTAVALADVQSGELALVETYLGAPVSLRSLVPTGEPSATTSFTTPLPALPGLCEPPVLVDSTGGKLVLDVTAAVNTGGVPVLGFVLTLQAPTGALQSYIEVRQLGVCGGKRSFLTPVCVSVCVCLHRMTAC